VYFTYENNPFKIVFGSSQDPNQNIPHFIYVYIVKYKSRYNFVQRSKSYANLVLLKKVYITAKITVFIILRAHARIDA
jgi:3-methyladenine DNA glycosylase Mpg